MEQRRRLRLKNDLQERPKMDPVQLRRIHELKLRDARREVEKARKRSMVNLSTQQAETGFKLYVIVEEKVCSCIAFHKSMYTA